MKVLDSFTLYYDKSEKDKLDWDEACLKRRGWNIQTGNFIENDELKGYYMMVCTEIDGFVPENLAESIKKYIFED